MFEAAVLGIVQGVTEWLPVSSEGVVAVVDSWLFGRRFAEAVAFALWLHVGTALSALILLRIEFVGIVRDLLTRKKRTAPSTTFLVCSTLISGAIGLPLLIGLSAISSVAGSGAMAVVGVALLVSAAVQIRRPMVRSRTRNELRIRDALVVGVAQGVAVVPGISRSGVTVAALLARGIDRRESLILSFILSVPASIAAALYVGFTSELKIDASAAIALVATAITGMVTIKGLLAVASQLNLATFVAVVGFAIIAGTVLHAAA